ncbi:toll-like receptor 12 [Xenopus laevis]|uniref:Toll-like receptor 12 n=2 Tax=Xenopus laevis TaxID=8355 RepID=A0A1L8FMV3_XENLA|nr:toll-like receptor 12 [Xenopus laevis]XP_041425405.1 toll-like receptor 12 [Xenopus laevis]XP_041425406.1 toll-like receptor 12 [Xenopus laevis]OCT72907.1 hypothetical protein XELAEV_18035888mg [Xenopus laevis]
MGLCLKREHWKNSYYLIVCIIFFLPSVILGWTVKKCSVADSSVQLRDPNFGKRCALYNNATSLALCANVTNITADISDVPSTIEILCLSGSNKFIQGGTFANFKRIIYLFMKMPLAGIYPNAFKGLDNLESLSISFLGRSMCNNLSLPTDVFSNLHSLKQLTLEGFKLFKSMRINLPSFTFLYSLALPANCITDLFHVFHIFQNVVFIHNLDVGSNKIESVNIQHIQNISLPNITELVLEKNPLKVIQRKALARFDIRLLNLGFTKLHLEDILNCGTEKLQSLSLTSACRNAINKTHILCSIADRFQLKLLSAPVNRFSGIYTKDFLGCSSLEFLNLNHNHIHIVDPELLYILPKLKQLHLSFTLIPMNLCPLSYKNNFTSSLEVLYFISNNIPVLKNRQFFCMTKLTDLILATNGIEHIEESAFWGLNNLQLLDLRNNKLTSLQISSLSGLSNLRELYIQNNVLESIQRFSLKRQTKLRLVKMDFVSVSVSFELFPNTETLDIQTTGKYITVYMNDTAASSLKSLSVNGSQVILDIKCGHPFFSTIRELKLFTTNKLISCSHHGPPLQHFKNLTNLQYHFSGVPLTGSVNFSNLPYLISLEIENLATALDPKVPHNDLFHKLYKLEILKLSNCGFKYFTAMLFKDMISLKVLVLKNEMILAMDPGLQNILSPVQFIYLYDVTFQCECENSWFVTWALKDKHTFVSGICSLFCLNLNKKYNLVDFDERSCRLEMGFMLFIVTLTSLVLFIVLTLLYNIFNSEIIQLFYVFQIWLKKLRGKTNNPTAYEYDAFVSYCSRDQGWVVKYLVPNLEEKGRNTVNLCLHNRDFLVGKDIVDNIMDSIYKSRKTICLISYNYLQSDWCSLEMRMATYKLLAEKNDDLILIFLENISDYHLSAYHRLARIVRKKTYIDWPQEETEQAEFWERLRMTVLETMEN